MGAPFLAALGGAAASMAGDLAGNYFSAKSAAHLGYKTARKLRRTAYQDTMEDMRSAGLNPILAYQKGATPATASPSVGMSGTGSRAMAAATTAADLKIKDEQQQLLWAQQMNEKDRMSLIFEDTIAKQLQNASSAIDLKIKGAAAEGLQHAAKVKSKTKWLNWVDPFLDRAHSASQILKNFSVMGRK